MPAPQKTYDLKGNVLTVGGQRIEGFSDTDAITYEWASDLGESTVSADGAPVFSRTNDERLYATIHLSESHAGYRRLAELQQAQALETEIARLTYFHRDLISGDEVAEQFATFIARPGPSKGRVAGSREFRLVLPNAGRNIVFGGQITG